MDTDFRELLKLINTANDAMVENYLGYKRSINIDHRDSEGRSILFYAVLRDRPLAVKHLLSFGADPNLRDLNGWTPLHYAAQQHLPEIAEALLENGAEVNATDDQGNTIIWRALFSCKGLGKIIQLLETFGADVTIKNYKGISAYDLAQRLEIHKRPLLQVMSTAV